MAYLILENFIVLLKFKINLKFKIKYLHTSNIFNLGIYS